MQPSKQHVAPCVKMVQWELGTKGLRMVVAFWDGIPVEITKEVGLVPRSRHATIGTAF